MRCWQYADSGEVLIITLIPLETLSGNHVLTVLSLTSECEEVSSSFLATHKLLSCQGQ